MLDYEYVALWPVLLPSGAHLDHALTLVRERRVAPSFISLIALRWFGDPSGDEDDVTITEALWRGMVISGLRAVCCLSVD